MAAPRNNRHDAHHFDVGKYQQFSASITFMSGEHAWRDSYRRLSLPAGKRRDKEGCLSAKRLRLKLHSLPSIIALFV